MISSTLYSQVYSPRYGYLDDVVDFVDVLPDLGVLVPLACGLVRGPLGFGNLLAGAVLLKKGMAIIFKAYCTYRYTI